MEKSKKGFTLIEILIVLVVISILIGIAAPRFKGMQDQVAITRAKGELSTLQKAVESYFIHNRVYPVNLDILTTAVPQIVSGIPDDPFGANGADYGYDNGGTNNQYYVIYSRGPDGDGSAVIDDTDDTVNEDNNPGSCIFISNSERDTTGP